MLSHPSRLVNLAGLEIRITPSDSMERSDADHQRLPSDDPRDVSAARGTRHAVGGIGDLGAALLALLFVGRAVGGAPMREPGRRAAGSARAAGACRWGY